MGFVSMIEIQQMTVEDFLLLMELNADVEPEFAALSDEQKKYLATINIIMGTAQSFWSGGRLVGVGGIRFVGLGEAWMVAAPQVREQRSKSLLKEARRTFEQNRDDHNLWRVFAENKLSDTFLKHLGFQVYPQGYVWMRI
jgi:hypothetical protein